MRIFKIWKKFRKPGENFQKFFGHPDLATNVVISGAYTVHKQTQTNIEIYFLFFYFYFCKVKSCNTSDQ